nr:BI1-like protein [Physcomitrium patens]|eukprot:XP_024383819.1 BI1-like protein [Physcomitrella patens]
MADFNGGLKNDRWGFIRKVYEVLSVQLLLTTIVAGSVVCFEASKLMCHLYDYPQNHTLNLFLLGLLTVAMSLSIGISSSMALRTFLEALDLTTMVVVSLTGYTYWAAKKGMDFHFLGPLLFTSLLVLNFFGFIQVMYFLLPLFFFMTYIRICLNLHQYSSDYSFTSY